MTSFIAFAVLQGVVFRAPAIEQTNTYRIKETLWTSQFGKLVMAGTEKRHVGKPVESKRAVDITFEVTIAEKQVRGASGEKWAEAELADLRQPDHGSLDDLDRLFESDGVAADAYPIFPLNSVQAGSQWHEKVNEVSCRYTLDKIEKGHAVISTDSKSRTHQGTALRSGSWTIEISSGRLLSWRLHSEVSYAGGGRETVDSTGELAS